MRTRILMTALALALAGCASASDGGGRPAGDTFISIVGTPFLLAFKIPVCAASIALAAPVAGLASLNLDDGARQTQHALGAGLAQNCGPPYVVSP